MLDLLKLEIHDLIDIIGNTLKLLILPITNILLFLTNIQLFSTPQINLNLLLRLVPHLTLLAPLLLFQPHQMIKNLHQIVLNLHIMK